MPDVCAMCLNETAWSTTAACTLDSHPLKYYMQIDSADSMRLHSDKLFCSARCADRFMGRPRRCAYDLCTYRYGAPTDIKLDEALVPIGDAYYCSPCCAFRGAGIGVRCADYRHCDNCLERWRECQPEPEDYHSEDYRSECDDDVPTCDERVER